MDFIREKLKISSIAAVQSVVDYLVENPQLLEDFVHSAIHEKQKYSWRYCWTLRHLAEKNKDLLFPFKAQICSAVLYLEDESSLASLLKTLFILGVDTENNAELLDFALNKIISAEKSAVKYYLLDFLNVFAIQYPEIIPEISETIQLASQNFASASLNRKSKNLLHQWKKIADTKGS